MPTNRKGIRDTARSTGDVQVRRPIRVPVRQPSRSSITICCTEIRRAVVVAAADVEESARIGATGVADVGPGQRQPPHLASTRATPGPGRILRRQNAGGGGRFDRWSSVRRWAHGAAPGEQSSCRRCRATICRPMPALLDHTVRGQYCRGAVMVMSPPRISQQQQRIWAVAWPGEPAFRRG